MGGHLGWAVDAMEVQAQLARESVQGGSVGITDQEGTGGQVDLSDPDVPGKPRYPSPPRQQPVHRPVRLVR